MDGEGFRRRDAASAVDAHHTVEQRELFVGQPRTGFFQPSIAFGKALADRVVEVFERHALRDADPQIGERRRLERAEVVAGHHRVGFGTIGDGFAIGPMESSVYDSGKAPSVGMRWRLGLKPTMPHSAAGMRVEPPVSLPMAISHMPSATATAPPDDEPPGTRRGRPDCRACRNAD